MLTCMRPGGVSHTSERLKSSLPSLHPTVLVCPSTHWCCPASLCQCGFRLREPEMSFPWHGTAQWHGQLSARLLPLACLGVQRAEAEVAVRLERTHAEFLGQGEGLAVVGFSGFDLWRLPARVDLAEEPQGVGFRPCSLWARENSRACCAWVYASSRRPASRYASPSQTIRSAWSIAKRIAMACSTACSSSSRASAVRPATA